MPDKRRFFSGSTIEQAVASAARHYGVEPAELAYREREKKQGFLRRRRGIVVEVDPAALLIRGSEEPSAPVESVRRGAATRGRSSEAETETVTAEGSPARDRSVEGPGEKRHREKRHTGRAEASATTPAGELFSEEWWQDEKPAGDPAEPAPPTRAASRADQPPTRSAPPADLAVVADAAREALGRLLDLGGISLQSEIRQGEDRLEVELSGNDQRIVLERGGEVLLALEHLLPRVIRGLSGSGYPCRVDADGFHAARSSRIRELAERRAGEVTRSRRRRTLPPMSPEERRIVHLALADRGDVQTESRGEGYFRRVTISPAGRGDGEPERARDNWA